ncbi:MAG: hypothetical protein H5T68_12415 [Chloroflexi bacterium]|nr:hypothetical protein [Chloroflexota bacterium]
MKRRRFVQTVFCLVLLLVAVGLTQAQEPVAPSQQVSMAGPVSNEFTYQGRLLRDGSPVNGNCDFQFQLWDAASGGTQVGSTQTLTNVPVNNGIFTVQLSFSGRPFTGDARWLQIYVRYPAGSGSYQLLTPRQPLTAVPYGFSLQPGATVVSGDAEATLTGVQLAGWPPTFYPYGVYGRGTWGVWGSSDLGLGVRGTSDSGIGVYGSSTTGTAIYAAGTGTIKSAAKSYLWISGNSLVKNLSGDTTRWDMTLNGGAQVYRGSATGGKTIYYPITIPAVLYGQPVTLTKLTVYYKCQDGSKNYIDRTALYRQTDADSNVQIIDDSTNRTSNTATSYTLNLTSHNTLSADQGGLGLFLVLHFEDDTNYVQIGGVRLELEHD